MSAWVCSHEHIDLILGPLNGYRYRDDQLLGQHNLENLTAAGRLLLAENWRSVRFRYPGEPDKALPSTRGEPDGSYVFTPRGWRVIHALKLLDSWDYQSCETPDFNTTPAYKFADTARRALITMLPGYDDAPWSA
jgi:hypothetical protein